MFIFLINEEFNTNNMSLGTYKEDTPGHTKLWGKKKRKQYYMKIVLFPKKLLMFHCNEN